ncbi:uncharacterized protein LOC100204634 isoform X1 [Hydra vulgaris]|uniref:uncharacterized protein LOC100204634 isoform X1 n=1 Tax=Hydra vulgaris TaxID=6087 RepID=UPI0001924C54|nr:uncharacterized protein LOC100204634 [Hydra vulgaris]
MKLIVGVVLLFVVTHGVLTDQQVEFIKDEQTLKKSNLVAVLPKLGKQFYIFFQIKLNSFSHGYRSVIHLTLGEDNVKYGDRIPGVWIYEQKLHVAFAISGNKNEYFFSKPLPLNEWISVAISQHTHPFDPTFEVFINEDSVYQTKNLNQKEFTNINVYAGDPWYEVQDGSIKHFLIFDFPVVTKKSLKKDAIQKKMFGLKS